jgi:diguanylate cyclase (GGDEF)-like protein/PAS domain S-box-containing protein
MKLRTAWVLLLLLALIGTGFFFYALFDTQTRHVARQNTVALDVAYRSTISMYRLDVETRFKSQVLRGEVLDLLERANDASPEELPLIRGYLYRALRMEYQDMVAAGLRQLHFHFPDGRSLLRFHSPAHLGDASLFEARPSIRIANTELRTTVGFEGGRVLPGFRNVFPIIRAGRHLGSVELSLPFERIHQNLIGLLPRGDYALLLHRDVVGMTFKDQRDKFVPADIHPDYFSENPEISRVSRDFVLSEQGRLLNRLLRKDAAVQAAMSAGERFSVPVLHDGIGYIASFHAIDDLQGRHAAYVIGYSEAPVLVGIRDAVLRQAAIVCVLLVLLALAVGVLIRQRHRLAEEKQRLHTITEAMSDGLYVIDAHGSTVFANQMACTLTGYSRDDLLGRVAHDLFHKHDDNGDSPSAQCPIIQAARSGHEFHGEEWFTTRDGHAFPVEVSCRPMLEGHAAVGSVILFRDISQRKQIEAVAAQAKAEIERLSVRNELLLNSAGDGIFGLDPNGLCNFINPAALAMLGYVRDDVIGRNLHALFHQSRKDGSVYPPADCPITQTQQDGLRRNVEDVFIRHGGDYFDVQLSVTPIIEQGEVSGVVVVFQDITERKRMEHELQRLATTDTLTGIANRRHFLRQLGVEMERVQRYGNTASLLMIDLDHFKLVNDRYGHAAGDRVLRWFAELTQSCLRRVDLFGRLGGEEFCVLLPDTGLEGAREFAERLRVLIEQRPCPGMEPEPEIAITVSIGVAACSDGCRDADNVLASADRALYQAKAAGRNRVVVDAAL